jgi:hypothetical protein
MRDGRGTRRRPARTGPALGRVSRRIGGSRTVVGCITRRGPRDGVDPKPVHPSDLRIRHSHAPSGPGRGPEPETSIARSGERGGGFEKLAPKGG